MTVRSSLTPNQASASTLVGDALQLNGVTAESIITNVNDTTNSTTGLMTYGALKNFIARIDEYEKILDGDSTFMRNLVVMSDSLINPYFDVPDDWVLKNWVIQDNALIGAGGYTDNSATINHLRLTQKGIYFLAMNVLELPSGQVDLYLNDTWLGTISETGIYFKEIEITSTDSDRIWLKLSNVSEEENIVFVNTALYYIAEKFYDYLDTKVRSLATVDAENFITKEAFNHLTDELMTQFNLTTNRYLENLRLHIEAENPHHITPELIGAAPTEHEHDNYLTTSQLEENVREQLVNYAPKDHNHDETYLKRDETETIVGDVISKHLNELVTVSPVIVTDAPVGILPSRYAQTDINTPLQILLSSTVKHNDVASFDYNYGIITTNREELMHLAPSIFSKVTDIPEAENIELPITLRQCYHHKHKVMGYKIRCQGKQITQWSVYSGNTTFIHRVTDPSNYITEDGYQVCEVFFEEPQMVESLAFKIEAIQDTVDPLVLNIEIIYNDYPSLEYFGITDQAFKFCVPSSGTNRVLEKVVTASSAELKPDVIVPSIPCYIYGRKELGDGELSIIPSYIPPEYATVCKGLDVLAGKYKDIERDPVVIQETYVHPAFGNLILERGHSEEGYELKQIYAGEVTSWRSDGDDSTVTITQTFLSNHVLLRSYLLNWRKEDVDFVPDTWTLTIEGVDNTGKQITVVADSVDQYYPFYSVEDDDIVYHATIDTEILASKVTLTMSSNTPNRKLALNKIGWYINEIYYSIPQNTMYYGFEPVSAACLGYVTYQGEDTGWVATNLCFGKSVVIPVNNLEKTERFAEYAIPNPFFSTDVVASVQNYALQDTDVDSDDYPAAYIGTIATDTVTIVTNQAYRYAVSISRTW